MDPTARLRSAAPQAPTFGIDLSAYGGASCVDPRSPKTLSSPAPPGTIDVVRASELECTSTLLVALNRLLPQLTDARTLTPSLLTTILTSPAITLLVARVDGVILGTATVTVCLCLTSVKAWVEDVVVDETARGRGLAKRLMDAAHTVARAAGADSVSLTSRPSRVAANQLYKSMGYEMRDTNVYRLSLLRSAGTPTTIPQF
jgi:ribosomal protein S18 acetylase RimI-like enzyme